ncbi:MAG: tRNA (adenosine(37)-N6)-threonylcarbamoyltransferase complex transferase subunit TsaD [Candidatus Latescibacteria bacterium]|nr:tRNA (adenosine(37)-N6)-threonylcarbamoyltransferase complex transferase subunit TsaD [Candidatus Latescibacterota bacterium]
MKILGIETSCDETSASVVDDSFTVHSNIIYSQLEHGKYGGVVPELASRAHIRAIVPVIEEAVEAAETDLRSIDGIAVTKGPGLVGSLIVGLSVAKGLALAHNKTLIGVHHLEGHIFSNRIEHPIEPPLLTLLASGGHTELVVVSKWGQYEILGRTRDDAAGEAFDKVAKLLGLLPNKGSVMGGRLLAELAEKGDPQAISFPRALSREDGFDFSFSGLKTAVLNFSRSLKAGELERIKADIAASFQAAVVDVLVTRTVKAMKSTGISQVGLAGGVAANRSLRTQLGDSVKEQGGKLYCPTLSLCTDNAAMIAAVGVARLANGYQTEVDLDATPRLSL